MDSIAYKSTHPHTYIMSLKVNIIKKIIFRSLLSLSFFGCQLDPNKEARIQQLESEIKSSSETLKKLEMRIQTLDSANANLSDSTTKSP